VMDRRYPKYTKLSSALILGQGKLLIIREKYKLTFLSQRAVYNRFHLEGLSTEHGRSKPSHAGSPADMDAGGPLMRRQSIPGATSEEPAPKAAASVLIEDVAETVTPNPSHMYNISTPSGDLTHHVTYGLTASHPAPDEDLSETLAPSGTLDRTKSAEKDLIDETTLNTATDGTSVSALDLPQNLPSEESENSRRHRRKKRNVLSDVEHDIIIHNLVDAGFLTNPHHSGGRTRHPYRPKDPVSPSFSRPKTPIGKICSFLHKKDSVSREQSSPFADNDSGYHSGRGTPSTLHLRDSLVSHPDSLTEFRWLYRVACYTLHEPKNPNQHRETQPCHSCGCSSIHIFAWSAPHLKLPEFEAELNSMDPKDVQALDAAGNSALHYAAVSGASYAHLKALIDAGVPVYEQNTAKQNFIHCLRPYDADVGSGSLDCCRYGLINLLESISLENIFGQQDNDGQTVLHTLASHIVEPELRDQTFK
jgi:hypothetical protein